MPTYDFTGAEQASIEKKNAHKKALTQQSGSLVSQLTVIKATFDELCSLVDDEEKESISVKFEDFKLDVKNTLGF